MNQNANHKKYVLIKTANFIMDQWNHGQKKVTEMYSTHNEGKSVFAERFIRTLKIKLINT